ncbi:hypothetical protein [Murinocardiopsis flavida]|uniref:hypothetical protein n=1 Tax=Murinocardiopsis flavida TaxID=645275 RepID=UPI0011B24379|nr:hypothetical protein [Murinocardiopsis flavida]
MKAPNLVVAATQILVVLISVTATLVATYLAQSGTRKLEIDKLQIQNLENRRAGAVPIAEEFIGANADFHYWATDASERLRRARPDEILAIHAEAMVHFRRISILNGKLRLYADDDTNQASLILVECALHLLGDISAKKGVMRIREETIEAIAYFQLRMRIYLGLEKETSSTPRLALKAPMSPVPKLDQFKDGQVFDILFNEDLK